MYKSSYEPQLSIIIPVYNSELYLEECLKSVSELKIGYYEVIVLDDGSTDSSGEICDRYAGNYPFIKVLHLQNGGPSKVRNLGLNKAIGKYVMFVDSDDYIIPGAVSRIIEEMHSDLMYYGMKYIRNGEIYSECKLTQFSIFHEDYCNIDSELSKLMTTGEDVSGYTWNKIFRRDIIEKNSIIFDESLKLGEDYIFTLNYWRHIKSIQVSSEIPYVYRISDESLSHGKNVNAKLYVLAKAEESMINHLPFNKTNEQHITKTFWSFYRNLSWNKESLSSESKRKYIVELIEFYKNHHPNLGRQGRYIDFILKYIGGYSRRKLFEFYIFKK